MYISQNPNKPPHEQSPTQSAAEHIQQLRQGVPANIDELIELFDNVIADAVNRYENETDELIKNQIRSTVADIEIFRSEAVFYLPPDDPRHPDNWKEDFQQRVQEARQQG